MVLSLSLPLVAGDSEEASAHHARKGRIGAKRFAFSKQFFFVVQNFVDGYRIGLVLRA